jgi:exodeoxyribonuclease V beta subunit
MSDIPVRAGKDYVPLPAERGTLFCPRFSGKIDRQWCVSSFSSLVAGKLHTADLADHDSVRLPVAPSEMAFMETQIEDEPSGIFSFPKGAKAGSLLHNIFEHLDFTQEEPSSMEELVSDKLLSYGFELTWQKTVCAMIQKVLSLPLIPHSKDFTLSRLSNRDRLNELEFYFPLKPITPKELGALFKRFAAPDNLLDFPEHIERLDFSPVKGFMKGFMDLVFRFRERFYLVDWKSNFLGSKLEDYGQEALISAMKEELYMLQLHLYAVALNQYLRLRQPGYIYERHFGGVYYIFLRGVEPERGPDFGIYRHRPSAELINQLCTRLISQRGIISS